MGVNQYSDAKSYWYHKWLECLIKDILPTLAMSCILPLLVWLFNI